MIGIDLRPKVQAELVKILLKIDLGPKVRVKIIKILKKKIDPGLKILAEMIKLDN